MWGAKARDKDVMMYRVFRIFVSKRKGFAGIRDGPLAHEAQTRTPVVKKRARELPYMSISPPKSRFLCGKKFASLLKEICFLPQSGGKFFAGCRFFVRKNVWMGLWKPFFLLDGVSSPARLGKRFVTVSPFLLTRRPGPCAGRGRLAHGMQGNLLFG